MTDKDLDIRDKWLGIKYLKRKTTRNLYETADMHGNITSFKQKAEAAADYFCGKSTGFKGVLRKRVKTHEITSEFRKARKNA